MGLGISGRSAAKLAAALGAARVVGFDRDPGVVPLERDADVLASAAASPRSAPALLTRHDDQSRGNLLRGFSAVVLSPGVPLDLPSVQGAVAAGVPVFSEMGLAWEAIRHMDPVAAVVTGTNGKSTTTTFACQAVRAVGKSAWAGGNLGTPLADVARRALERGRLEHDVLVLEASSYQLELPGSLAPRCAAITNLTPDHLERHGALEAYAAAKCGVGKNMGEGQTLLVPAGAADGGDVVRAAVERAGLKCQVRTVGAAGDAAVRVDVPSRRVRLRLGGGDEWVDLAGLAELGDHNLTNAGVAVALARLALGPGVATAGALAEAARALRAPRHRVERVVEARGVLWVNDSKATNVEASAVGVRAMGRRPTVVLLGGRAKRGTDGRLGFERLAGALAGHRVVCFGEAGDDIHRELCAAGVAAARAGRLRDAMVEAARAVEEGGCVLLSPGCASFDEFRGFEHRGDVFCEIAAELAAAR